MGVHGLGEPGRELEGLRADLAGAASLVAVLRAGLAAFGAIEAIALAYEERDDRVCSWWAMAAAAAADGDDALAAAPSLPATSGRPATVAAVDPDQAAGAIEDTVASLAAQLAACLTGAAARSAQRGDRAACERAAAHARHISELLTGDPS
jgi:hypothetical protein